MRTKAGVAFRKFCCLLMTGVPLRVVLPMLPLLPIAICVTIAPLSAGTAPEISAPTTADPGLCVLAPLVKPPTPPKIPGYTELDPSTGLHVTGGIQDIDLARYRLEVTGKVSRPLSLSYDELRCMPRIEARPDLICPGFFKDVATWAGTPLKHILELAKVTPGATAIRLSGADNYHSSVPLDVAGAAGNFLAYEWEGKSLPALHGFPLRAVLPGQEGNMWVKWLIKIEVY